MQTIFFDISNKYAVSMEPKPAGGNVALQFKQGNVGQKIKAVILDQEDPYNIPNGAQLSVWFSGPSGEGNYSSIDERSAFEIKDNIITVELISQMLINPGNGTLCLILNSADGSQLGLWNVVYAVEHVPGMGSKTAESYYTALSELARQAINAAATFETDATLSVSGKAADAATVGAGLAGKAPAGYGLGVNYGGDCADCNTAVNNGWYNITSATANCPVVKGVTHNVATMFVVSRVSRIWQTIYSYTNATEAILRRRSFDSGSTWSEWEWVNPSMNVNAECRTTERWNGKAVYTKLVDCGALPNATTKTVAHAASAKRIVRCVGQDITSGRNLPYAWKGNSVEISSDKTHICITTNGDFSANTAYAQIWYTKD